MRQTAGNAGDSTNEEINALVEACIAGDPRAWRRFVDRYRRLVYAVPIRLGLPPDGCDDVFQSVFAIVLRELPRIRDRFSLPKWLITVAQRESSRWARQQRLELREGVPAIEPALPDSDILRLERQHFVHEALDELGGRCRELLTALFLTPQQPSYQEVALRLGMPVGAIGPTRSRCLRKMLELLGDRLL